MTQGDWWLTPTPQIPLDPRDAMIRYLRDTISEIGAALGCPSHGSAEILEYARTLRPEIWSKPL